MGTECIRDPRTTVKIWDLRAPGCQREYESRAAVNTGVLHPNQTELISGDQNGNIRVWDLTTNSCSCELGMLHSRGELLLMLDADGATKVNDVEKLEKQIHTEFMRGNSPSSNSNSKISDIPIAAFGSRAHLEEKALASRKWYRNFLMKSFHLVVLLAAGPGIRDTQVPENSYVEWELGCCINNHGTCYVWRLLQGTQDIDGLTYEELSQFSCQI